MKVFLKLFILIAMVFSTYATKAKGYCDMCWDESCIYYELCRDLYNTTPINFGPSYETAFSVGNELSCTDGTFSVDISFDKRVVTPDNLFKEEIIITGFGPYGPRLQGTHFESKVVITEYSTRVGQEISVLANIEELKGKLSLRQTVQGIYNDDSVHGWLSISEKLYSLVCK